MTVSPQSESTTGGGAHRPTPAHARPANPPADAPAGSQAAPAPAESTTKSATPPPAPAAASAASGAAAKPAEPSIGQLVSDASTAVSTLIHSEIELAKLELRSSIKNAGVGAGLFAAAAVVLVFSLTFGFIALAEGIAALGLSRWLAFLIVFAFLVLVAGAAVFLGIRKVKRVKAPKQTIETTKETVDYLKKSRG